MISQLSALRSLSKLSRLSLQSNRLMLPYTQVVSHFRTKHFFSQDHGKDGKDGKGKPDQPNPSPNPKNAPKDDPKSKLNSKENERNFFDQFWNNDKGPEKKPNPKKQDTPRLQRILKAIEGAALYVNSKLSIIYRTKFTGLQLSVIMVSCFFLYTLTHSTQEQITSEQFMRKVANGEVKQIRLISEQVLSNSKVSIKKLETTVNNVNYFSYVVSFQNFMKNICENKLIKIKTIDRNGLEMVMYYLEKYVSIITSIVWVIFIRSQLKSMGSSMGTNMGPKAKKFDLIKNVKVRFADVAGMQESKRQVQEIVQFLKFPPRFLALGATIPKGVLLTGPPGTGKTLLAKATAGEAGVPFYSVSGSDFVQVFVGVGASRVRELFQQAKENSPSIIFIDELDAVGKKRSNRAGGNDERQSTLNQLLVEMDGFGTNSQVIIMAATNRKEILDPALVRAGRFDREVEVTLPDLKGRFEILHVHLQPLTLSPKYSKQEYAKRIASLTPGFSGAQIANLCNQAAILAARCGKKFVEMLDFELSSERVIGGVERKGFVSLREKRTVAYHESGHAVVSWFLEGANPLLKVTIIPRSKGALGFAQYFVNENQLQTKEQLMDRICFILGGRCAELFFFNEVTTGAYDDLQKAYNTAYQIVSKFGMNSEVGYLAYPDARYTKPFGEKVEAMMDGEIKKIIEECTIKTKAMIVKHKSEIVNLAEELLKRETIDVRMLQKILGKRPFAINKTFQAYLETEQEIEQSNKYTL